MSVFAQIVATRVDFIRFSTFTFCRTVQTVIFLLVMKIRKGKRHDYKVVIGKEKKKAFKTKRHSI